MYRDTVEGVTADATKMVRFEVWGLPYAVIQVSKPRSIMILDSFSTQLLGFMRQRLAMYASIIF